LGVPPHHGNFGTKAAKRLGHPPAELASPANHDGNIIIKLEEVFHGGVTRVKFALNNKK
jgi:hypothetical protein